MIFLFIRYPALLITIIGDPVQEACGLAKAGIEKNGLVLLTKVNEETGRI